MKIFVCKTIQVLAIYTTVCLSTKTRWMFKEKFLKMSFQNCFILIFRQFRFILRYVHVHSFFNNCNSKVLIQERFILILITIVVLFGGGLMLNNFGVFLSIMTIISFKAYRISFVFACHKIWKTGGNVYLFLFASVSFCDLKVSFAKHYWI